MSKFDKHKKKIFTVAVGDEMEVKRNYSNTVLDKSFQPLERSLKTSRPKFATTSSTCRNLDCQTLKYG